MIRVCFLLLSILLLLPLSAQEKDEFQSIFNGKDLTGWEGKPGAWTVQDGAIHCKGDSGAKNWLIWRGGQPGDFVLKLEFLFKKGNSGVQVRSDDIGDWQVQGYQVEVAKQDVMGLWHHSLLPKKNPKRKARFLMATAGEKVLITEKGKKSVERFETAEKIQSHFKENEWNEMEIIAEGDTLTQKINGVVFSIVVDRDKEESRSSGFIALQDHGSCIVSFRNIQLKTLK